MEDSKQVERLLTSCAMPCIGFILVEPGTDPTGERPRQPCRRQPEEVHLQVASGWIWLFQVLTCVINNDQAGFGGCRGQLNR